LQAHKSNSGFLRGVLAGVVGNAVWWLLVSGVALGALGALAAWLGSLAQLEQGMLYGAGAALVLVGLLRLAYRIRTRKAEEPGEVVHLLGYLSPDGVLRNVDLRDRFVVGPAVILRGGEEGSADFFDCTFDGLDIPPTWVWPLDEPGNCIGAVRAENCRFYRCRFSGVSWAYPEDEATALWDALEAFNAPPSEDPEPSKSDLSGPPSSLESSE
jgi:uncharacterized membrane protein (UPF0136 family)